MVTVEVHALFISHISFSLCDMGAASYNPIPHQLRDVTLIHAIHDPSEVLPKYQ
jgi:hypothetical protein